MTLQNSTIFIDSLRLHAFHGVMEQERRVGADFLVSLQVHYNVCRAMETDDLADTLSYAALCDTVRREMAIPSRLLEHVAGRIAKAVVEQFPQIAAIDLRLAKLNPPMGADCEGAGVEIHLRNDRNT